MFETLLKQRTYQSGRRVVKGKRRLFVFAGIFISVDGASRELDMSGEAARKAAH